MNKRNVIILVAFILVVILISTICIVSCGAFSTPKLRVYNLLTQNEVVQTARENNSEYEGLYVSHSLLSNAPELQKVIKLSKITSNVIEELTLNTLFVKNTSVSDKKVQNAYNEYLNAKAQADAILNEAANTGESANWVQILKAMVEKFGNQTIKYSNFASELLNYVNNACFEHNPKTVKHTTLSFIQGFNNAMIQEYIGKNKLSNNTINGIGYNEALFKKYTELKTANIGVEKQQSLLFIESFYLIDNLNSFYLAYSKGSAELNKYVYDPTNFNSNNVQIQKVACENVLNFITLNSFVA